MVVIENKNTYKIGDNVWWFDAYRNLQNGIIYDYYPTDNFAAIKQGINGGIHTGAKISDCWPTKDECLKAENRRAKAQKQEYKDSINTVEDLIRFLYTHDVQSEYRDYDAKAAVEERAAELGISLTNE